MRSHNQATAAFIEDYTYLREIGLDHNQIAQRLGVQRLSLLRRADRHHCYIPEHDEIPALKTLHKLIDAGEQFQVHQHFSHYEKSAVDAVIKRARADGLIEPAGWGCDGFSRQRRIWRPAVNAESTTQEVA